MLQKKKETILRTLRTIVRVMNYLGLALILFILTVYIGIWGALPSKADLTEVSSYKPSQIFDINNELIGIYYLNNRVPVSLDSIPQHVVHALIATEDARFYDHNGVDARSALRVIVKSLALQDASSGGGSTLTQQLAKNMFDRKNLSFLTLPVAKVKEMIIAQRIEKLFTKEQILELYLNAVPFSGNTYGIESASLKYFGKSAIDLTVTEGATLIGTLKATHYYNPQRAPARSTQRRNTVLNQMAKYGFLTVDSLDILKKEALELDFNTYDEQQGVAPHFRENLRQKMVAWCKENSDSDKPFNLYTSGLKIYTTIDLKMQRLAETAAQEHMQKMQSQFESEYPASKAPWRDKKTVESKLKQLKSYQKLKAKGLIESQIIDSLSIKRKMKVYTYDGYKKVRYSTIDSLEHYLRFLNMGMLAINPQDGAVSTWVGGVNFEKFKYGHIESKRQVGSTFKPIVYATALEEGQSPCQYFSAREVSYENYDNWSPSNSDQADYYYQNVSMTGALTRSLNAVSVKILEKTGIEKVIAMGKKLEIKSTLPAVPSLALGTAELSVKELAGAYAAFVNESKPVKPYFLSRIEDSNGKMLEEFKPKNKIKPAFSENTRQTMITMMESVIDKGTGKRLRSTYGVRMDVAGKTGTTQNNKDAWFVAVTPTLVAVTWVGHDDHRIGFRSTRVGQGANAALPIVAKFLRKIERDTSFDTITKTKFKPMSNDVSVAMDCPDLVRDGFLKRLFTNPEKKKTKNFKKKN
ncbi:penicillin-binding protein [Dokdonia sinensis]|uniref:Penicillin-binding protein n=1 Tax=Dokdonia sinensis TaxID=2479847 RepID=A0A3M0G5S3_9FLAO|nr:transglycosylase domain-containing protein [Dokdonia sinensis]RMB57143.1 penicillin-binding protein [Dokdonia sinensis]